MGWADCGLDSQGRPIGYVHAGVCDHPECEKEITRGLAHACGGMHGKTEFGCEKYFCEDHLQHTVLDAPDDFYSICGSCAQSLIDSKHWYHCEQDDVLKACDSE